MIRWGIIGPGRAAARFVEGLAGVPDTAGASVWGRNPERARAFASRFSIPHVASSVSDLLDGTSDTQIDAVYISTHPDTHAALSIKALRNGKHVLCEKPSTLNVRQLEQVLESACQHDRLFMEAMKPPFFPLYARLRAHLQSDSIGPVGFVRAGHCDATIWPSHPIHLPEYGGGGVMGIGPYEAFLALDWLGPLKRVQTMGRLSPAGVDNFAVFQSEHEHGMAQLHTGLDLLSRGDALLCGPRGYVLIHANWWNPARATIHYVDGRQVKLEDPFAHGGFNYETEHFCRLLREGVRESPLMSHARSLAMMSMLDQVRAQLGIRFPGE